MIAAVYPEVLLESDSFDSHYRGWRSGNIPAPISKNIAKILS
jgi:hypothetical protein